MNKKREWTDAQVDHYLEGIKHSDYPALFWQRMLPYLKGGGCRTVMDIGSGPGAFALRAAEDGFIVQAVDSSRKSLDVLETEASGFAAGAIKTICGNWPDVIVDHCDAAICAYSFGGDIGTSRGISEIFKVTGRVIFFISPVEKTQVDFLSRELYEGEGSSPPEFKGNYHDVMDTLAALKVNYSVETVSHDFGFPLKDRSEIDRCALFLADKLGLSSTGRMKKHLEKIIIDRNNMLWVPNPRVSALITCLRSE
jgi:SAM-dependent methyltransferase